MGRDALGAMHWLRLARALCGQALQPWRDCQGVPPPASHACSDDVVGMILEAIRNPAWQGVYNATAPNPVSPGAGERLLGSRGVRCGGSLGANGVHRLGSAVPCSGTSAVLLQALRMLSFLTVPARSHPSVHYLPCRCAWASSAPRWAR